MRHAHWEKTHPLPVTRSPPGVSMSVLFVSRLPQASRPATATRNASSEGAPLVWSPPIGMGGLSFAGLARISSRPGTYPRCSLLRSICTPPLASGKPALRLS